jgi:hypothetical protein
LNVGSHTDHAAAAFLEMFCVRQDQDGAHLATIVQQRMAQHLHAVCLCQPTVVLLAVSILSWVYC